MNINWDIIKNCGEIDRQEAYEQIGVLLDIAAESLSTGIIAFIKEIERDIDPFFCVGYKLLVSGVSPESITNI